MTEPLPRSELLELAPLLRRGVQLDPASLARVRIGSGRVTGLLNLPFHVLVGRTVAGTGDRELDVVAAASSLLAWLDGDRCDPPAAVDALWPGGLPPERGWTRVESIPDTVVRDLVRRGALALEDAAAREGVPGAQPRAQVTDALLDSVVLTASANEPPQGNESASADRPPAGAEIASAPSGPPPALRHTSSLAGAPAAVEVNLRTLSAVTRMGFLPPDSHVALDVCGRWLRVAAPYGSVYAQRPGLGLTVLR